MTTLMLMSKYESVGSDFSKVTARVLKFPLYIYLGALIIGNEAKIIMES